MVRNPQNLGHIPTKGAAVNPDLIEAHNTWLDHNQDLLDLTLPVSEVFGPTIQGEGPHAGRVCHFIRLGGCNLSCTWCDTPYSTGQHGIPLSTIPRTTIRDLAPQLPRNSILIITGGEPLMHAPRQAFEALLHLAHSLGNQVHVETNGTILPEPHIAGMIDHFTVSPKTTAPMRNDRHAPSLTDWEPYADKTCFKYVIDTDNPNDADRLIQTAKHQATLHGCHPTNIWAMPEGTTTQELQAKFRTVAEAATHHNINTTHRLHTLAWGNQKGH